MSNVTLSHAGTNPQPPSAALRIVEELECRFVEAPSGQGLMRTPADATLVLEACFSHGAHSALLYASSLPPRFFDLSSGEAGTVLQKLRQYEVRLAVVYDSKACPFSSRFGEMLAEEHSKSYFHVFPSRAEAVAWLVSLETA